MNINTALLRLSNLAGNYKFIPRHKGSVGLFIESLLDLRPNCKNLDFTDGELKSVPIIKSQYGYKIKETVAISMINNRYLLPDFYRTKYYEKIRLILFQPYSITGTILRLHKPTIFDVDDSANKAIKSQLEDDYNLIRTTTLEGDIKSHHGILMQSRTKGQKSAKTRAFYFKRNFLEQIVKL